MSKMIAIGEASRLTGLAASAIRYYEEQLLIEPARLQNGRRVYDRADIQDLTIINDLRQSGMTLADLLSFQTKRKKSGLCKDLSTIAFERTKQLRRQINALRLAEARLAKFANSCLSDCGDALAADCCALS